MQSAPLSALFPAVPLSVGGERLFVRPVSLGDMPVAERVLAAWLELVSTGGQAMDESAWDDFIDLLASSVNRPRSWVGGLDEADFERLVAFALAVNEEILRPSEKTKDIQETGWPEIIQRLVSHGHAMDAIKNYTLSQARAYLLECYRAERDDLARGIQAAAFSMSDGETVKKALEKLNRV
jgi:hypothetical protein